MLRMYEFFPSTVVPYTRVSPFAAIENINYAAFYTCFSSISGGELMAMKVFTS